MRTVSSDSAHAARVDAALQGSELPTEADLITLTCRQLAEELGVSVVAARTRARRAAAAGRWRVLAGNRPGAPSYIQIPAGELAAMGKGAGAGGRFRTAGASAIKQDRAVAATDEVVLDTLRSAYRHIERLNQIALIEKDERRVAELRMLAAERVNEQLRAEVGRLERWGRVLDEKLADAGERRDRLLAEAVDLRASDRQRAARVLELESRIVALRQSLCEARWPWWKRLLSRRQG